MEKCKLKDYHIKLPESIIETLTDKDIVNLLMDKAQTKKEYYYGKCSLFENKYGEKFDNFKSRINNSDCELLNEWDDLIVWEGYNQAYTEWNNKYQELAHCMK